MDSPKSPISKEQWMGELRVLAKEENIYMRFLFVHGHILAKPSRILVTDRKHLLLQRPPEHSGPDPIELWIGLPDDYMAVYEKRASETGGVCLSITYKIESNDQRLHPAEQLYLSNEEALLDS